MSYIRRGDIMICSMDLNQLPDNSASSSNTIQYDRMGSSISESSEHYATLGRHQRNTADSCCNSQCHRCNTNTSHVQYTRYIRPCNDLRDMNCNNSHCSNSKPTTETETSSNPVLLRTSKKRKGDSSRVRKKKVIFSFICGVVFGFIIFSIVWLTVDRLKENKIVCEFSVKSKGEVSINDKNNVSTSTQRSQTTTQDQVSPEDGYSKNTLTTRLIETSKSVSMSPVTPDPAVPEPPVSRSSYLSSREQTSTSLVPDKTTITKLLTLFSSTRKDTSFSSELSSTRHFTTGERNDESTVILSTEDQVSSTTQIVPKTSSITTTRSDTNKTTSGYFHTESVNTSITPSTSNITFTKQTPPVQNDSYPTTKLITVSPTGAPSEGLPENVDKRSVQGGYVYVRWGSLLCPDQSEQMYRGHVASGHYQHQGGATNTICLPEVPTWGNYSDNADADRALVYGTEYGSTDSSFTATTGKKLRNKDVPCSVCQATVRLSHVMIPGRAECFPGWTREYKGYLMGSGYIQNHASELICVDSSPDHVTGSSTFKGGNMLYLAEVRTGTLPSPPYVNGRELTCVVCTL